MPKKTQQEIQPMNLSQLLKKQKLKIKKMKKKLLNKKKRKAMVKNRRKLKKLLKLESQRIRVQEALLIKIR
jgi:hypothetical protein